MPVIAENQFASLSKREFWITQDGRKLYPHQFEDEHLKNTINFLHRKAKLFRLEQARDLCELVHRKGHRSLPIEQYYRHFKREMDNFLGGDVSDKDWLKVNSKIYNLLIEEAEYRGVDIVEETKTTWKQKLDSYRTRGGTITRVRVSDLPQSKHGKYIRP